MRMPVKYTFLLQQLYLEVTWWFKKIGHGLLTVIYWIKRCYFDEPTVNTANETWLTKKASYLFDKWSLMLLDMAL